MRYAKVAFPLFSLFILVACTGTPSDQVYGTTKTATTSSRTPTPSLLKPRTVSFVTQDGLRLYGSLYGRGRTAVICSNMFDGSQADWNIAVQQLLAQGYMVLTYDYRGNGNSQGTFEVDKLDKDLQAALDFIYRQGATKIALMGASMGGTVTIEVAAREKERVTAIVVISAPLNFRGLNVSDGDLKAITAPAFFINSNGDGFVPDIVHMYDELTSTKQIYLYPGEAHGTDLFTTQYSDDLLQRLEDFFQTYVLLSGTAYVNTDQA